MSPLAPLLTWIQSTSVATLVSQTLLLNAALSSLHLVGGTLLVGGVLVSSLRLMGAVLRDRPVAEVTGAMRTGILIGLAINIVTGLLMVSPRATDAAANWIFQAKMTLLAAAVLFYFGWYRPAARGDRSTWLPGGAVGAIGLALWLGVLAAGVGFILVD
jgi:uncharacterized protein DUF6644